MPRYKNTNGDSGIRSYQIGLDYIDVQFTDGWKYRYSYSSAGQANVEAMKLLADAGDGLNSFINQYVKQDYSRKWR